MGCKLTQLDIFRSQQLYYSTSAIERTSLCRPASMAAGKAVSENLAWTVLRMLPLFGTFAFLLNHRCIRDGASRTTNVALDG